MSTRPPLGCSVPNMVQRYLGTEYDKVKSVADNIETVIEVTDNLDHIKGVNNNLGNINTVADNIADVVTVSDNIDYVKDVAEGIEGLPVISYIGDVPPTQPMHGAEWYCTTDGRTYVWHVDSDSSQWVESSPQSGGVPVSVYIGNTPPLYPEAGATWYCSVDGRNYIWYEYDNSGQWVESSPQSGIASSIDKMTLNADATDVTTVIALVNQIRAGLIANGLAQ